MKEPKEMTLRELEIACARAEAYRLNAESSEREAEVRLQRAVEDLNAANDQARKLVAAHLRVQAELRRRRQDAGNVPAGGE